MPLPTDPPHAGAPPSRRGVLRLFGGLGLAAVAGLDAVRAPSADAAVAAPAAGTDTLVVLSLRGGLDGLSMIPPVGDAGYAPARPTIAVPARAARAVDRTFGLHPALSPLFGLWDTGKLAAVHAVGQPVATGSHREAIDRMERATSSGSDGWIDRMVAQIPDAGAWTAAQVGVPTLPTALQGGHHPYALGRLDAVKVEVSDTIVPVAGWQAALTALARGAPAGLTDTVGPALAAAAQLQALPPAASAAELGYPPTDLGQALHDVARLIKARFGLRAATVEVGGWDLHAGLGRSDRGRMVDQLGGLSLALAAFAKNLGSDLDHVTLVTMTEFGRRVAENGSGGVDHGHGSAMLVLGGAVNGGKVHGSWPTLAADRLDDGGLAVSTDYRQVLAEILTARCGIASIAPVFPGLTVAPLRLVSSRT
jgi:uncharacterized protein (DUF1501 family)